MMEKPGGRGARKPLTQRLDISRVAFTRARTERRHDEPYTPSAQCTKDLPENLWQLQLKQCRSQRHLRRVGDDDLERSPNFLRRARWMGLARESCRTIVASGAKHGCGRMLPRLSQAKAPGKDRSVSHSVQQTMAGAG